MIWDGGHNVQQLVMAKRRKPKRGKSGRGRQTQRVRHAAHPLKDLLTKTARASSAAGYTANFVVTAIATLVTPLVGYMINSPKAAIISAAIGITALVWLAAAAMIRRVPAELPAVTVSPTSINLRPTFRDSAPASGMKITSELLVQNNTDKTYYQVYLKLLIDSPDIEPEQIGVSFPTLGGRLVVARPGTPVEKVSHVAHGIYGHDGEGRKALYIYLHKLQPRETVPVVVTSDADNAREASRAHTVEVSVRDFQTTPPDLAVGAGSGKMTIRGPDKIEIRILGIFEQTATGQ